MAAVMEQDLRTVQYPCMLSLGNPRIEVVERLDATCIVVSAWEKAGEDLGKIRCEIVVHSDLPITFLSVLSKGKKRR